ncbi:winged helix-turn-helix domain-containing protein [Candidatus Nitrosotenuis cloacae]
MISVGMNMKAKNIHKIEIPTHPDTKKLFWNLFSSARGTANRIKIVNLLAGRPSNPNQMSRHIGIDYKVIKHHLNTLEKNHLVERFRNGGINTYFVSPLFKQNQQLFEEIITKL